MSKQKNIINIDQKNEIQNNNNFEVDEILTNNELQNQLKTIIDECDEHRKEALDAYYEFRNLLANSGDFESSAAVKEQISTLLQTAQGCVDSKIKIFDQILKTKLKNKLNKDKQNNESKNFGFTANRRDLLQMMKETDKELNIIDIEDIDNESSQNNNDESEINKNNESETNNNIDINSGDF